MYLLPIAALVLAGCQPPEQQTGHGSSGISSTTGGTQHVESTRRTFPLKNLQRVTLKINGKDIKAWVMDDYAKRQEGMMWLVEQDVKENEGMIFAFPDAQPQSFWMENTILPLDIMYISAGKKVLNIQQGKPYDQTSLPSKGAAQFVLEMRQGAAKKLGIKPGTVISIPATVKGK